MRLSICAALWFGLLIFSTIAGRAETAFDKAGHRAISDKAVVEQFFGAWNSHDPDKVASAFSETGVYEDVTAGHVSRGRAQVREWAAGGLAVVGDFKIVVVSSWFNNGRGMVEWLWTGTDLGLFKTLKKFSVRGVSVVEIRKGKITSYKEFYDYATVMSQLGVLPAQK